MNGQNQYHRIIRSVRWKVNAQKVRPPEAGCRRPLAACKRPAGASACLRPLQAPCGRVRLPEAGCKSGGLWPPASAAKLRVRGLRPLQAPCGRVRPPAAGCKPRWRESSVAQERHCKSARCAGCKSAACGRCKRPAGATACQGRLQAARRSASVSAVAPIGDRGECAIKT